jgi:hypothetical protein
LHRYAASGDDANGYLARPIGVNYQFIKALTVADTTLK